MSKWKFFGCKCHRKTPSSPGPGRDSLLQQLPGIQAQIIDAEGSLRLKQVKLNTRIPLASGEHTNPTPQAGIASDRGTVCARDAVGANICVAYK
jgi:hypothetical protein